MKEKKMIEIGIKEKCHFWKNFEIFVLKGRNQCYQGDECLMKEKSMIESNFKIFCSQRELSILLVIRVNSER
jgi:hypothetical protein